MTTTKQDEKAKVVANILKQSVYQPDSGVYGKVFDALMKMPARTLHNLDLILTFRISESNDLCREVDRILGK